MTVPPRARRQVRERAAFRCEFCGVHETDTGGELTIDHFQPSAKGGSDDLDNLIYCCSRCNQYKLDYWPTSSKAFHLWNPRREPASRHFLELEDGTLHPLTEVGELTLRRLRLNRPPLVAYRLRRRREADQQRKLERYEQLSQALETLTAQQASLMEEQRRLLQVQLDLLRRLVSNRGA